MTRKCKLVLVALTAVIALLVPSAGARAQPAPDLKVEKGFDLFRSLPAHETIQSFSECPVPGTIFESQSPGDLTGCESFDGDVRLQGSPLGTFRGFTVGAIDTVVERKGTLNFGAPMASVTRTTPIELVALSLVSVDPVRVQCDQGVTEWSVFVEVDPATGPSEGEMEVTLEHPALAGGTAVSELEVCPRVTFVRVDGHGSGSFELHPCDLLCGPRLLGETAWSFEPPAGAEDVLRIDGLTTDNFYFAEPPSAAASARFRALAQRAGLAATPPDCECGFQYPHLSPTHVHQACTPCPCDADIVAPTLATPSTPTPPLECTGKNGSGQGGIPASDPFVAGWLNGAVCEDATSPIDHCGPITPPSFFPLGAPEDPPAGCVGTTPVTFRAEDECGNRTDRTVGLAVRDTGAPTIAAGEETLDCLTPPAGGMQCYYQDPSPAVTDNPFDFETIREGRITDLCSEIEDWWFVGCASDQPDDAVADGNTVGDCVVGADRRSFCVRAERAGGVEGGRRYAVEIQATDRCGNVSAPTVIGTIHVPLEHPPPDECTEVEPCRPTCSAEPTTGEFPLTVSFSSTSNCAVESWSWDFGDGTTSPDPEATSHVYMTPSTYEPILTVEIAGFDDPVAVACPVIAAESDDPRCSVVQEARRNGRFVEIDIGEELGITGEVTVTGICQDELVKKTGGDDAPDGRWPDPAVAEVRGQRDGQGDGRSYFVSFLVDGEVPATCGGGVLEVCIPHGGPDDGCGPVDPLDPLYDSTREDNAPCPTTPVAGASVEPAATSPGRL